MKKLTLKPNRPELETQLKYFSFYKKLPIIIACVIFAAFFIWAIVDPCVFVKTSYLFGTIVSRKYYGIMMLRSGFLCWLIWFAIGTVTSAVSYFLTKFVVSYKLLQIYYLQKIAGEENKILKETIE